MDRNVVITEKPKPHSRQNDIPCSMILVILWPMNIAFETRVMLSSNNSISAVCVSKTILTVLVAMATRLYSNGHRHYVFGTDFSKSTLPTFSDLTEDLLQCVLR